MIQQGGRRIVRLVRILTAVALIAGATTIAMIGATLAQVHGERAFASAEQGRLRHESDELRQLAIEAETETTFGENLESNTPRTAVSNLYKFVRALLESRPDPAVLEPLARIEAHTSRLTALAVRGATWRARSSAVSDDVDHDRTIGKVRLLISKLRGGAEEFEGQLRLGRALQYNRLRHASGQGADSSTPTTPAEKAGQRGLDLAGFGNDLSDLARLAEVLNGEVQLDRFADLKDNQFKPILDSLNRAVGTFRTEAASSTPLSPQSVNEIESAIYGDGYIAGNTDQSVQLGRGGLFPLRQDVLQLQRELVNLKSEQGRIIFDIEADNALFAQSAQLRTLALAQQMEHRLAVGWQRSLIVGAGCATLFLWLAWLITRGIGGQVVALEERTTELTLQIAQREHAEQDLGRLRRHQDMIFNTIGEGIYWFDLDGCITFQNPAAARLLGWEGAGLVGHPAHATMHHTRADGTAYPKVECPIYMGLQTGVTRRVDDEVFWRKDGTSFPVEYTTTPVRENNGQIVGVVVVFTDITERKRTEADLERTNRQLRDVSRQAGMAEVATGVLHNVGNVLNSVNVSSALIGNTLRKLRVSSLAKIAVLLGEHEQDLGAFMTSDPRGKMLPGFLSQLAGHLSTEQETVLKEVDHLQKNIEHIKEIVKTQQTYASSAALIEPLDLRELFEAALRMNAASLNRHEIVVVREFQNIPPVPTDKHRVLQILVNLITNARQAMKDCPEKTLTLGIQATSGGTVRMSIGDTGCGIASENITRVFAHGFTTKSDGHGFGLHSSALAAREMSGSLTVHSDGPDRGAIFTLELPSAASRLAAA